MTYTEAKATKVRLERDLTEASAVMQAFPRSSVGLTPDYVKATPEYQVAKRASAAAFKALQIFNTWFVKTFAAEYRADRRAA